MVTVHKDAVKYSNHTKNRSLVGAATEVANTPHIAKQALHCTVPRCAANAFSALRLSMRLCACGAVCPVCPSVVDSLGDMLRICGLLDILMYTLMVFVVVAVFVSFFCFRKLRPRRSR